MQHLFPGINLEELQAVSRQARFLKQFPFCGFFQSFPDFNTAAMIRPESAVAPFLQQNFPALIDKHSGTYLCRYSIYLTV